MAGMLKGNGLIMRIFTFQLLQRFDAMGPDVDSCMGKMKDMYTRSKLNDLKVGNLQEINKNVTTSRSVLE